jgi:hypothetical protein
MLLAGALGVVAVLVAAGWAPLQRGRTVWNLEGDVRVSMRQKGTRCRLDITSAAGVNTLDFVGPSDAAKPELLTGASGEIWIRAKERPADAYAHFDPTRRVWRTRDTGALEQLDGPGPELSVVEPAWWAW